MLPPQFQVLQALPATAMANRFSVKYRQQEAILYYPQRAAFDSNQWKQLLQQLQRCVLKKHSALRGILAMHLDGDAPWVAMELLEPLTVAEFPRPLDDATLQDWAITLLEVAKECDRLGIDSKFPLSAIGLTEDGSPRVDPLAAWWSETSDGPIGLAAILDWLRTPSTGMMGTLSDHVVHKVIDQLHAADPEWMRYDEWLQELTAAAPRPSATIEFKTEDLHPGDTAGLATGEFLTKEVDIPGITSRAEPKQLGRFRVLRKLGQGGMGAVYLAEDQADQTQVALKTILATGSKEALKRFHKEARLLAEVNNPYVANLIEINEDLGIPFIALEFVDGKSLADLLREKIKLEEKLALAIGCDICRALVDPHRKSIVHRDIKPDNILIPHAKEDAGASTIHAKLTDFGLARHTVESASLEMTRAGAIMGTPMYMAPEQCSGERPVDARTDVYSLGATLFHCLTGRTLFQGSSVLQLIQQHLNEPAPKLSSIDPAFSEGLTSIIAKCLAKLPGERYADAANLLEDLERVRRGQANLIQAHPRRPIAEGKEPLVYDWSWDLESSPMKIWPFVSNTERFNRAVGASPPVYEYLPVQGTKRKVTAELKNKGIAIKWEEHPFEWVEGRRFGVLREFEGGPFKWLTSVVELEPLKTGTRLHHTLSIVPTGLLGRTIAAVEIGIRSKKSFETVYKRMDAVLAGKVAGAVDPFVEPVKLTDASSQRITQLMQELTARGVEAAVTERLEEYIRKGSDQQLSRMRPISLARQWGLESPAVVNGFLQGASTGLFILMWDLICPLCRIPSEMKNTLKELSEHGHCAACRSDYNLELAKNVEMIFRIHPEIRKAETRVFCVGGPAHSPHVVAQVRLAPGERMTMDLQLEPGQYRLRGPQLPFTLEFRVEESSALSRLEWDLRQPVVTANRLLQPSAQRLELYNSEDQEIVVRVERSADRTDALTAARATMFPRFRELFPSEVLQPGRLAAIQNVTLLATALEDIDELYTKLGDGGIFQALQEHFEAITKLVQKREGAIVKTVNEGVLACFPTPQGVLELLPELAATVPISLRQQQVTLRAAVQSGSVMAATLNDHLDYFGSTVKGLWELLALAGPSEVLLSEATFTSQAAKGLLTKEAAEISIVTRDELRYASLKLAPPLPAS